MRTIKFKGKSVDSSEWVEGYYEKACKRIETELAQPPLF